jgi:methionyl-tRNA formyltransferase
VQGIALFCNGERGESVRKALLDDGHEIQVAFTPRTFPTVDRLRSLAPLLSVVAGFPIIFTKAMIDVPRHGTINCHAGPVPNYRGGSPLNWQIINGEKILWVSLLKMDEGLDTGPVLASTGFRLEQHETIADAHQKANIAFAEIVAAHVWLLENSPETIQETPQEFWAGIRAPKTWPQRNDDMGMIDLDWPPERINNFVRALTRPYPGAWLPVGGGEKIRIWEASE